MLRGLAVLFFVTMVLLASLPQLVSAGQDGPGQSVRIGTIHPHDGPPPLKPFGQDGPGQ
jgi:hypothetical protein